MEEYIINIKSMIIPTTDTIMQGFIPISDKSPFLAIVKKKTVIAEQNAVAENTIDNTKLLIGNTRNISATADATN